MKHSGSILFQNSKQFDTNEKAFFVFEQCELQFLPVNFVGVVVEISPYGNSTDYGSLRTTCREYFGLWKRKHEEAGENCMMRSFVISLLSHAYPKCPAHFVL
jgi:hypothetical protein